MRGPTAPLHSSRALPWHSPPTPSSPHPTTLTWPRSWRNHTHRPPDDTSVPTTSSSWSAHPTCGCLSFTSPLISRCLSCVTSYGLATARPTPAASPLTPGCSWRPPFSRPTPPWQPLPSILHRQNHLFVPLWWRRRTSSTSPSSSMLATPPSATRRSLRPIHKGSPTQLLPPHLTLTLTRTRLAHSYCCRRLQHHLWCGRWFTTWFCVAVLMDPTNAVFDHKGKTTAPPDRDQHASSALLAWKPAHTFCCLCQ